MNETVKRESELLDAILQKPDAEEVTVKEEEAQTEEVQDSEITPSSEPTSENGEPLEDDDTLDGETDEEPDDVGEDEDYDDEEDDLDESEDQTEDDLITVVIDGEEQEVTLEELKSSFSGNAYMAKQVQEATEDRKAAQTELAQANAAAHEYIAKLNQLDEILSSQVPQEPDWNKLKAESPELYNKTLAEWNDLNRKQAAVQEAREAELKQQQARDTELKAKHDQHEAQLALQKMPHLSDQEVAQQTGKKWLDKIKHYGFTEQEFAFVTDHRLLHVIDDFVRLSEELDEIKGKRRKAKDVNKGKRRVKRSVRPNAATAQTRKDEATRRREAREQRARRSGRVEDVAATLIVGGD
jgi:hypothetical protein